MDLTEILFAPILPFVDHPDRIAAVAILLWVMVLVLRAIRHYWSWPLLWVASCWTGFAIWEWLVLLQAANIRVDLMLIYPLLLGITIWGLWAGLRRRRES